MLRLTSLARHSGRQLSARAASTVSTSSQHTAPNPTVPSSSYDPEEDPQLAGLGYPKVYSESRQLRSPRGWWDSQERVNFGEPVPENDDIQSMWAPDVHKVRPSSAVAQLATMFSLVGLFSVGVYFSGRQSQALPRAYPYDGLVKELSGTDNQDYAARPESANEIEE